MAETRKVLCLTICGYKKKGMSQEDYREYMTNHHAPLIQGLMARYGLLSYSQVDSHRLTFLQALELLTPP